MKIMSDSSVTKDDLTSLEGRLKLTITQKIADNNATEESRSTAQLNARSNELFGRINNVIMYNVFLSIVVGFLSLYTIIHNL